MCLPPHRSWCEQMHLGMPARAQRWVQVQRRASQVAGTGVGGLPAEGRLRWVFIKQELSQTEHGPEVWEGMLGCAPSAGGWVEEAKDSGVPS